MGSRIGFGSVSKPWEDFRIAKGWRKVATGHWLYDGIIPKPIELWAKPASESSTRYNDDEELDESRPIPESNDGFLYCTDAGHPEFGTIDEAKAYADALPWGPITWGDEPVQP
jgi:hypothetical protein